MESRERGYFCITFVLLNSAAMDVETAIRPRRRMVVQQQMMVVTRVGFSIGACRLELQGLN